MRVGNRRPKQPVTWIPAVLQLFQQKGCLTSQELAKVTGKKSGGDAITRCRQLGLPLETAGLLDGSRLPHKLNTGFLWFALEEAVKQINRYALILNGHDRSADCQTFRNLALWIEHVHRLERLKTKLPTKKNKAKHRV